MSSNSSSVRPTSGPRSSAPSASVSRRSASTRVSSDQVLDLLAAEEALAGLGRDRDAAPLQCFLIAPQLTAGRRQAERCRRVGRDDARLSCGR